MPGSESRPSCKMDGERTEMGEVCESQLTAELLSLIYKRNGPSDESSYIKQINRFPTHPDEAEESAEVGWGRWLKVNFLG